MIHTHSKHLTTLVFLSLLATSVPFSAGAQTAADFQTAEYYKSGGLDLIRAADAYALGYTGRGVTVGVADDGYINFGNPELMAKTGSYNAANPDTTNYDWKKNEHPSHVSGIIEAGKDDAGMHGTAFDVQVVGETLEGIGDSIRTDLYADYTNLSQVKVINNSWGSRAIDYVCDAGSSMSDMSLFFSDPAAFAQSYKPHTGLTGSYIPALSQAAGQDKLLLFASANEGHTGAALESVLANVYPALAYNLLNVTAADNKNLTISAEGTLSGSRPIAFYSNLAKYAEDFTVAAPGVLIYSADANYAASGTVDVAYNGTSMATPFVTGVGALVQQAYPYLNAKQIGDVLLSTANNKINPPEYQVICQEDGADGDPVYSFNVLFSGAPEGKSESELRSLVADYYRDYLSSFISADYWKELAQTATVRAYYYTDLQEYWGQGMVDAAAAVKGPGALNARRLTKRDISTGYTVQGTKTAQALYAVDTQGYNSIWSNDIREIKAGLLTAANTETDLAARYEYYDYNWLSNAEADANIKAFTQAYVDYFNKQVESSGLKGLSVGLLKQGEGTLALTGTNTYKGSTIVQGGAIALTGSLTGDAYTLPGGTLTGTGTVNGSLTNNGTLVPGLTAAAQNLLATTTAGTQGAANGSAATGTATAAAVGTLTVTGDFTSTGKLQIAVSGTDSSQLAVSGVSRVSGTTLSIAPGTTPLINHKYNYLTSQGGIDGKVAGEDLSPYVTLNGSMDGKNAYFTASQKQTLGGLSGMTPSEQSVGAALNQLTVQMLAAAPNSAATQNLNALLYQDETTSRKFTRQVTSEARAQLLQQSPLSSLTSEAVYNRLDAVDFSGLAEEEVKLPQLTESKTAAAEYGDSLMRTTTPVALDSSNNLWFKLFKGYETYNYADELKNQTFGGAIGYDHAVNLTTRVGGLFSYGKTHYSTDNISGDSHDWRIGAYVDHKNGNWDYQGLISYGRNHYDLDRSISLAGSSLGNGTLNSDYKAKVWDVEAKAKYLIPSTKTKTWQFTPYGKVSYTHTSQDAYGETGGSSTLGGASSSGGSGSTSAGGLFAQNLDSASNNSWRGEVGLEFKRSYDKNGGWGGSVGYKRVLSGVNPELNGTFATDTLSGSGFTIRGDNDKDFVTYSLNVHGSLGGKWTGQAELRGEASRNTHKEIISVAAKYHF